jgi:hypothetical protein
MLTVWRRETIMRNLILSIALALLSTASIVQAQAHDLPPCSEVELLGIHRIMPGIDALFDLATEVRVMDDVLAYGQAQISWREQLWASTPQIKWRADHWARLPLCGDSFEYLLRLTWINSDLNIAAILHFFADVQYDDNPFWPQLTLGKERADTLLERLRSSNASQ